MSPTIPFTAAEDAIVVSERRRWPMNILIEADVVGALDEERLATAVDEAVARYPSAGYRRVRRAPFDRHQRWESPRWLDVDPIRVGVGVEHVVSQPLDLDVAPPFRLVVNASDDGSTRLALCAHHGAFDGLGAMQFLRAILASYSRSTLEPGGPRGTQPEASSPESDPPGGGAIDAVRLLLTSPRSARLSGEQVDERWADPTTVTDDEPGPAGDSSVYGLSHRSVEPSALAALRGGVPVGATVNDALVTALHLTIGECIRRSGRAGLPVSIAVPMSGRPRSEEGSSIGNRAGQTTVWSDAEARRDSSELLRQVHAQMATAKEQGIHDLNTSALGATSWLPVRVRAALPRIILAVTFERSVATSRLSNLGRVDAAGLDDPRFEVRSVWFSPPCRPPQSLVIGASTFGGRLGLTARWCRPAWDRPRAERFLALFCRNLEALAGSTT